MRRFADLFVAICILLLAVSAGVVAHFHFGAEPRMATAFAVMALAIVVLLRLDGIRRRNQRDIEAKFMVVAQRLTGIDGEMDALERRLGAIEDGGSRRMRDEHEQLLAEVEAIGSLTRQVIETVADLELQVAESRSAPRRVETREAPPVAARTKPLAIRPESGSPLVPERFGHLDADGFLAVVRGAIDQDRIDLHLQPIVTLPQRKVRFYECLTRLRTADGETIHPSDYIPVAEARGYIATVDQQILMKSVQILRRLASRSKEVGIFLNLSPASLADGRFFEDFVRVLEGNRDLCDMLVLEFPHTAVRTMGPLENEGLRLLRGLGFRFSIDQVADLKISFQNLADLGFRFVKISTERLLGRVGDLGTDIHPSDLADYFQRFGMELIADHVEREVDVVDVLDFGVRYGQGFLFAPPRPVRAEVLQGTIEPKPAARPLAPAAPVAARPATSDARPAQTAVRPQAPAPAPGRPSPQGQAPAAAASRPAAQPQAATPARPAAPTRAAAAPAAREAEAPRPGIRIVPGTALR